ncbi:MAG: Gfo/Idh/MocA family oxidoreductase [Sphaerochaetaceae bacterium]
MDKKQSLRAGLIGSGFAARFHVEALRRVYEADVEIVGVYSPTASRRDEFAAQRNIKSFASLDQLIDACDVLHVCSPPSAHEQNIIAALEAGKHCIVEKPFTGYFGDGTPEFNGHTFPREKGLEAAVQSLQRIMDAEKKSAGTIAYAENWVFAPSIQKEREILEKTGGQILWLHGEESHSGSHSIYYGMWSHSGGGSVMGKGVHPLSGALYLKKVEGRARNGKAIRPVAVSARTHRVTTTDWYKDEGFLRTSYTDVEDYGMMHVVFEDGSFADIFASELALGGVHNWLEVCANNHRTRCLINPNNAMETFNPKEENFKDIYVVEKIGTKQGWAWTSPDEDWFTGYQHEMNMCYKAFSKGEPVEADSQLAADTIAVVYAAYLSAEQKGKEVKVPLV